MKRAVFVLALMVTLGLSAIAWGSSVAADGPTAQSSVSPGDAVAITGAVVIDSSGRLTVGGYVIVPMTSNVPASLRPGDVVIVIGVLQADGRTIYTDSITLYDDSTPIPPTAIPTAVLPSTLPPTLPTTIPATFVPFPTPIWTPAPTNIPVSNDDSGCEHEDQPVAQRIADAFKVSYDDVMRMHCDGNGFGEITRAFVLQTRTGVSAWTYLQRHKDGEGWGEIIKDAGVAPSDLAPGQVISNGPKCEDGNGPPGQCKKLGTDGPGNGNGNGKDKCEDGNGPPGQCKKLGEGGPGNGNGNGNGHGKGHGG